MTTTLVPKERMVEVLCGAFDRKHLEQLVQFKLGKDLHDLVPGNQGYRSAVSHLVSVAEREGWTDALVRAFSVTQPNNPAVKEFVERHWPLVAVPQEPAGQVRAIIHGLEALTAPGRGQGDPFIHATIARSRADIELTLEKIDCLRRYAELYDHLHHLGTVNAALTQAAALHRQSKPERQLIELYSLQLERDAGRARTVAGGLRTSRLEIDWIDRVESCAALVRQGLETQDDHLLQRGVFTLQRVVQVERVRIGALFCLTAGELRLGELTQVLREIDEHLRRSSTGAKGDLPLLEQVRWSRDSLVLFQAQLDGLVNEFFEWQWLEKELAAADVLPGVTPEERFPRWSEFRDRLLGLCEVSPEKGWAKNLLALVAALEEAGKAGDAFQFQRQYNKLCLTASRQVFDCAGQLLDLSDQISQVVKPLEVLLRNTE